jgi:Zn-dependent protease/CBS domain-containing protein
MHSQIRLGQVFGIRIGLHYSWFIIAFLIAFSLSAHFHATQPAWTEGTVWLSAGVTAALFFATLLLHELSHALTARARGLPVGEITLFALGGVSRIKRESEDAKSEFLIGVVGPATSFLIGLASLGTAWAIGWEPSAPPGLPVVAVLVWLGYINLVLAVFNMIPGYPLDGGRVLRAAIWGVTGNGERATRAAARVGQAVALLFIFWGILRFFAGAGIGALWLAFIGWFLLTAAGASYGRLAARDLLSHVRASELMSRDCPLVEPHLTIARFVSEQLLHTGRRCFLVANGDGVVGLLTVADLKTVERERWETTPVESVMRPLAKLHTVGLETPASECFDTMTSEDLHQLPVVEKGELRGIVSRGDLMRVLRAKSELGA